MMKKLDFKRKQLKENALTLNVLLVESNISIQQQVSQIIKNFFLKVVSCTDYTSALQSFQETSYDVIIIDISNADADILISKIRKVTAKKPIVLLSDTPNHKNLIKYINMGIHGFIQKPIANENEIITLLLRITNDIIDLQLIYNIVDHPINPLLTEIAPKPTNIVISTSTPSVEESLEVLVKDIETISVRELIEEYPLNLESLGDRLININEAIDLHINKFIQNNSYENAIAISNYFEKYSLILSDIKLFSNIESSTKRLA